MALTSDTHYGFSQRTHAIHEEWLEKLQDKIVSEDVRVLIHAGDWIANKQDQLPRTLNMFRKYIKIPIVAVRGNHCLWDYSSYPKKTPWDAMNNNHFDWFKAADIHHLENGPYLIENHIIVGFDGWYNNVMTPTRDVEMMVRDIQGANPMMFHNHRAHHALDNLLDMDVSHYDRSICVTHFPPFTEDDYYLPYCSNPAYFQPIKDKFDIFCTGHSHQYWNEIQDDCVILNSGSDYDKPEYIIFETEYDKEIT